MFYEYDDNNADDNNDIGDITHILYFPYLITQFTCCYVLFSFPPCLYLIFLTDKPPKLQIYIQCQIYPRSISHLCMSIYSSIP